MAVVGKYSKTHSSKESITGYNLKDLLFWEFDKPERLPAFAQVAHHFSDQWYWRTLSRLWTNSESLYLHQALVRKLLTQRAGKLQGLMMNRIERKKWRELPDTLRVYRGCWRGNVSGWSWTLNRQRAIWFANWCPIDGQPLLISSRVKKRNAIAYLADSDEAEIIIDPAVLGKRLITKLRRKVPSENDLLRQEIQAGTFVYRVSPKQIAEGICRPDRPLDTVLADLDECISRLQRLGFKSKVQERKQLRLAIIQVYAQSANEVTPDSATDGCMKSPDDRSDSCIGAEFV